MDQQTIKLIIGIGILFILCVSTPICILADSIDKLRFIYMKTHNIPIRKSKLTLLLEKYNIIKNYNDNKNNNNDKDNNNKSAE